MIIEDGTKRQIKRCVLDTVCIYVYRCGHVYVPGAGALETLEYRPGQKVTLANTDCGECRAAKQDALYTILMYAQRASDQARAEADGARNVHPTLLHGLPEEVARLRGTDQYTCFGVDMSRLQQSRGFLDCSAGPDVGGNP